MFFCNKKHRSILLSAGPQIEKVMRCFDCVIYLCSVCTVCVSHPDPCVKSDPSLTHFFVSGKCAGIVLDLLRKTAGKSSQDHSGSKILVRVGGAQL